MKSFRSIINKFKPETSTEMLIGYDRKGRVVTHDFYVDDNLFISGMNGSGKTVTIKQMLISSICKQSSQEIQFALYDPKGNDYRELNNSQHSFKDIMHDKEELEKYLKHLSRIVEERKNILDESGYNTVHIYNSNAKKSSLPLLPNVVNIFDEIAPLIIEDDNIMGLLKSLLKSSKNTGIYFILSTQFGRRHPNLDEIKKERFSRISLKVQNETESEIAFGECGAEQLDDNGNMLYKKRNGKIYQLKSIYLSDKKIEGIINDLKEDKETIIPKNQGFKNIPWFIIIMILYLSFLISMINKIVSLEKFPLLLLVVFVIIVYLLKDKLVKEYKKTMNFVLGQFENDDGSIAHYLPTKKIYESLIVIYVVLGLGYAIAIANTPENLFNLINIIFTVVNILIPLFYISIIDSVMRIILKNNGYKIENDKLEEDIDRIKITAFVVMIIVLVLYIMANVFRYAFPVGTPINNDKTIIEHKSENKNTIDEKKSKITDKSGNVYRLKKNK